jgi:hypothetical protein
MKLDKTLILFLCNLSETRLIQIKRTKKVFLNCGEPL